MTDNETPPQCRAELCMSAYSDEQFRCVLAENHAARHMDSDGDTWDITCADVDPPQRFVLNTRPVQEQLTALTTRVGLLEAAVLTHPTVLATQMDGRQVMSDGSVRDPENEAVLIDPGELGKLREASERLDALEAAGVDNWDGYEDALNGIDY